MTARIDQQRPGRISREFQGHIRMLTNWQRNQWARAGYPVSYYALTRFAFLRKGQHYVDGLAVRA